MPPSAIRARLGGVGLVALMLASGPLPARAQETPTSTPARLTLGGPAPRVRTEVELRAFLDELEAQELMVWEALALETFYQWKGETNHHAAAFGRLSADLTTRRDYAAVIDRWRGRVKDSTLARRLDLHHRDFLASRVDPRLPIQLVTLQASIQDTVSAFRFDLDGQKVTRTGLSEAIDTSADRSRRERAYRAARQISPRTRGPILRAMGLVDEIGRREGFPNGAAAGLVNSSLEAAQVLRDLDAFEVATRPVYLGILERAKTDLGVSRLEPWDIRYWLHLQEGAAGAEAWSKDSGTVRLRRTMIGLGFAFDSLPITIEVREVPTGGITFPIRPPFEARLLSNPFSGSEFYSTLLHEYGHALNFTLLRPDLPAAFLRGDETPLGEGVAETLGLLALDHGWLTRIASVPPDQALALERAGKMKQLLWLRGSIAANAYAEISHYLAPRADFDSLCTETVRRFVGVEPLPGDQIGTRDMLATGPLYFQSYLYADMAAAQLLEAMREQFGVEDLTGEARVGPWLTEHFFAPGASIPWQEKILRATGQPLSTAALGRYFADAAPAARR